MVHQKYSEATYFSKILKSYFSVKVMKSTEFVAKFKTFICFWLRPMLATLHWDAPCLYTWERATGTKGSDSVKTLLGGKKTPTGWAFRQMPVASQDS